VKQHAVVSSNVESIGYSRADQTLQIVFKGGRAYTYAGVPFPVAGAMFHSASKGKAFNRLIRDHYPATRVQ
jgi:hypothetical protein